jgi:hypothetical protein
MQFREKVWPAWADTYTRKRKKPERDPDAIDVDTV